MPIKNDKRRIKVNEDGPYTVSGGIPLVDQILVPDSEGLSKEWKVGKHYPAREEYDLCRCGQSKDMPYCDLTHGEIFFDGTETASRKPFIEQIEPETIGPELIMTDVVALCANARFCDRAGGAWDNTRASDNLEAKKIAIQEVWDCPAGRLVLHDKHGNLIEPKFAPSIGLVVDPVKQLLGPIWVQGGIPIKAADGTVYEIRNRVTLCRCGKSSNKPFCDGKHEDVE
ncbi:MAG TPA: CDGSH iron-sulfur domain-containing protein [Anaerolineales bacterium]